ncbi:MAG: ligase-associated DNA damage response endonuclease PdeM [Rhodobacterales bacterium]|nr:ligase-associated DNA damage response endonuclease PdeM [Rhodobacterales bacterium]
MNGYHFTFAGADFIALGSGALLWPEQDALILADLHLGKSERMARRGGSLLPPFETRDTLLRLQTVIKTAGARRLFLLGDVFDDDTARETLEASDAALWQQVTRQSDCCILAGNHDPSGADEVTLDGIALRHIAARGPDISGHYHPKARLGNVARTAFLIGQEHLILPAFGTFTGGLFVTDPVLASLADKGVAVMTGLRPIAFPLGARRARHRIGHR